MRCMLGRLSYILDSGYLECISKVSMFGSRCLCETCVPQDPRPPSKPYNFRTRHREGSPGEVERQHEVWPHILLNLWLEVYAGNIRKNLSLVKQSPMSSAVTCCPDSILRLRPDGWFNDELINAVAGLVETPDSPQTHILSSYLSYYGILE